MGHPITVLSCIICGGNISKQNIEFSRFVSERMFGKESLSTSLATCLRCGFMFCTSRPNEAEMNNMYSGYQGPEYTEQREKFEPGYRKLNETILGAVKVEEWRRHFLEEYLVRVGWIGNSILDFGGSGRFLPKHTSNYVYDPYNTQSHFLPESFDLIVCTGVMEHVSSPIDTIKRMLEFNGSSYYFEFPFEGLRDSTIHEHLNFFNIASFARLMEICGLEPVTISVEKMKTFYREINNICSFVRRRSN